MAVLAKALTNFSHKDAHKGFTFPMKKENIQPRLKNTNPLIPRPPFQNRGNETKQRPSVLKEVQQKPPTNDGTKPQELSVNNMLKAKDETKLRLIRLNPSNDWLAKK